MEVVSTFFTQPTGWYEPLPDFDSAQTLVLVFSEVDHRLYNAAIASLLAKYPNSVITGCSAVASIFNQHVMENALVVGIIRFQSTRLAFARAELNSKDDSWQAGQTLAQSLQAPDLKGVLLLTDGLNTQGTDLIRGMASRIDPHEVKIVGGLASDPLKFVSTWVLIDGVPATHMAVGVGFYGDNLVFASNTKDGFKPFGPERVITRAVDRILYEIDHRPALQLYKEYIGAEHVQRLPLSALNFPLSIWHKEKQHYAIRVPVAVDEASSSLHFIADIPDGCNAQLMYGSMDNLLDGVEDAAQTLRRDLPADTPILALAISCAVHKLVMGDDTSQELETVLDILPPGTRQVGFYTFGELAPTGQDGNCSHHNATMTLTVLYEKTV